METKLKAAEAQKAKVQMSIAKEKLEKSKKYRLIEKEVLKVILLFYFMYVNQIKVDFHL